MHSAEEAHDTTLLDEKYDVHFCDGTQHFMTSPKLLLWTSVTTSHVTCMLRHLNICHLSIISGKTVNSRMH